MRLKLLLFALILTFATHAQISHAAQQTFVPDHCGNTDGAYYRADLFPKFTNTNNRLVLADLHTNQDVTVLAEALPYTYTFDWSPDCHYLVGMSQGYYACAPGLIIWDTVSGEQKLSSNGFCDGATASPPRTYWRPDGSAVLFSEWYSAADVDGSSGSRFIWYPATNQRVDLQAKSVDPTFAPIVWDDGRGWLWTGTGDGANAYDIHTGVLVAHFMNPPHAINLRFSTSSHIAFSPDQTKAIVYGQHTWDGRENEAMTVYDIASGIGTQLNVERNGAGEVALSPDNRYLVMGYTALRVWDLNALPAAVEDRLPTQRLNTGGNRISAVKFVDSTIVEVTTMNSVSRWNISTGAQIS